MARRKAVARLDLCAAFGSRMGFRFRMAENQNGRDAMLRRVLNYVARGIIAQGSLCCAQFAFVAICLATCCLQWVSLVGTSLPATLAIIAALTLGFAGGGRRITAIGNFSLASL